jgi:hypothetical protein
MFTAAYGVEATWGIQKWLLKGFDQLTAQIGRAVTGTFSTSTAREKTPMSRQPARPSIRERHAS